MFTIYHSATEFENRSCGIAVLPLGAVEQHGRLLPLGTDILLAQSFAGRIADKLGAYLLPPLSISSSIEHRKTKGTVYLRGDTLALIIRDISESLRDSGFERLVLANWHGGNWILKPTIRQLNRDLAPFRVVLINPDLPPVKRAEIFEHPVDDVHGGEFETSLMLHLHPELVGALPARTERSFPPQAFLDYFDTTELTPEGYWGWPELGTVEKGRRVLAELVESAMKYMEQIEEMSRELAATVSPVGISSAHASLPASAGIDERPVPTRKEEKEALL